MKIHLADFIEPIPEGRSVGAVCGFWIDRSAFVFMWDDVVAGHKFEDGLNALNTCKKCVEKARQGIEGRYVYGVVQGEDARQEDR